MKPFLEEKHLHEGQEICQRLVKSMQQIDPKSCIVGLAMACVFASDATDTPLESVFQFMRDLRKSFGEMQKALDDAKANEPKIIVP